MARPREFDELEVLDAAIACFWQRGFEATSVRDLAERTGITCASLYNAFGDKRSLFKKALDHYVETSFGELSMRLEESLPPREAIEIFFQEMIAASLADPEHKGCMLVNSVLDVSPHDPEFQCVVAEVLSRIEEFFLRLVTAGQRDGTISGKQPAADLARHLLSIQLGLRVLSRVRPERELLKGLVRPSLALLDDFPETAASR
jgi:TetR/AcrR family transcriptional regulator, transcriptional repressor for nem operon